MDYQSDIPHSGTRYDSQIFEVHYANWRHTIMIIDPATNQITYTLSGNRTHNSITNSQNQNIGTSKTSSMTSKVTVTMSNNSTFDIHNDKFLGFGSPTYTSPALSGQDVIWKNRARSRQIHYTLIDGSGLALAKFEGDVRTKIGKFEIAPGVGLGQNQIEEVVVVLLTLLRRKMRAIQSANSAAVVSAVS